MNKKLFRYVPLALLVAIVLSIIIGQRWTGNHLVNILSNRIPDHFQLEYSDLQINILTGSLEIENLSLNFTNPDTTGVCTNLSVERAITMGFSLWKYLFGQTIFIDEMWVEEPRIRSEFGCSPLDKDMMGQDRGVFEKEIEIGSVEVVKGSIDLLQPDAASGMMAAVIENLQIRNARIDSGTIMDVIPFKYDAIDFKLQDAYFSLGDYEELDVKSVTLQAGVLQCDKVVLESKYGKHELSAKLNSERDHVQVYVPQIVLDSFGFGVREKRFFVSANQGTLRKPEMEIYRDKLVPDDTSEKNLYSHLLRNLSIGLSISALAIEDGQLGYEERVSKDAEAGRIFFVDITSTLNDICNWKCAGIQTTVEAEALFMQKASVAIHWSFDISDTADAFGISGSIDGLQAESINSFLEANMRSRARGSADKIHFKLNGDREKSIGDLKVKHTDLEFVVLRSNGKDINRLLTSIGNLFLRKVTEMDERGFQHGSIQDERDPTKSFFHFLWINLRNGLISALTGDGEKENKEK